MKKARIVGVAITLSVIIILGFSLSTIHLANATTTPSLDGTAVAYYAGEKSPITLILSSLGSGDVLYLEFVGYKDNTISVASTGLTWVPRATLTDSSSYVLKTYYATSSSGGSITITVTVSGTLSGDCAVIAFAVKGANPSIHLTAAT
ncbi:MAG: hypothetical protein ABSE15_06820 [Candidatus Bathyarchaeia archaeon]|jgi:hypothetical protein